MKILTEEELKTADDWAVRDSHEALRKRCAELEDALGELVDIVQAHRDGEDSIDSFTLQPARRLLAASAKSEPVKCGTFGDVEIPPEIRAKMDADRAAAERTSVCVEHGEAVCPPCLASGVWTFPEQPRKPGCTGPFSDGKTCPVCAPTRKAEAGE